MSDRPRGLAPEYGSVFGDPSVVRAYAMRPAYPEALFAELEGLLPVGRERCVLELGCGTGDLTVGLAPRVDHIDAVDPAGAMLSAARGRSPAATGNVCWIQQPAESFVPQRPYAMVVAAESLHWMDWGIVLPRAADALEAGAVFAIVLDRVFAPLAWSAPLQALIATHSTNREYQPFDLIDELTRRGLFTESGRFCAVSAFTQPLEDYVESFHSRNGFSRDRMDASSAAEFDAGVRALVLGHAQDGVVTGEVRSTLVWGRP